MKFSFLSKGETENLVTFVWGGTVYLYESESSSRSPPGGKK